MLRALRDNIGSSFSDLWYRVGPTRPRIGRHCQVIRQRFGMRTSFIVEDPAGGQYYRLSESAYFFLGLLDGRRSVDDAWQACNAQLGDAAPTQRECIDLLARLQLHGLLAGDAPLAPDMIEERRRQARMTKIKQRTGMGIAASIPVINPEPFLERASGLLRAVFSWWGLAVWLGVVGVGLYCVLSDIPRLTGQFNHVLDPANLAWMGIVFLCLRAWHELGHAAACKAMGARCTEIGIILMLMLLPFPYCDASSSWRLPATWRRVLVSAAGMIFETFVAAIAAIIWSRVEPGTLLRTICYNTMIISGVTTLVFNLNPLLRYDGYYILSDLTGTPNLWQRSRELTRFLLERFAFGLRSARPPAVRSSGEFWLLLVYGLLSLPYRIFVTFTIILVIWSNPSYLTLGAVLAVCAAVFWVFWPPVRGAWYLATSPRLLGRRARAVGVVAATVAALTLVLAVIPMPAAAYAPGVVRPENDEPLRPAEDGFVEIVNVRAGEFVAKGGAVLTMRNPELTAALAEARARLMQASAERDAASLKQPAQRQMAEKGVDQAQAEVDRAQARVAALVLRAPIAGRVVASGGGGIGLDFDNLTGRFVPKGSLLGSIASTDDMVVRAVVSDRDQAWVFREGGTAGVHATIRVRGRASDEIEGRISRAAPAGSRKLDAPSLGAPAGGEIVLDPTDPKQQTSLTPQFIVEVKPVGGARWASGQRAQVRLGVAPQPLVQQWWRRLVQTISERSQI